MRQSYSLTLGPMDQYHGTTILSVRRGNVVAIGGDGQVTLGNVVKLGL